MITRIWHGITSADKADEYATYVEETGMNEYRGIKGNLSARMLMRIDGEHCHFLTVTEWDSYESIRNFAGEDFEKAKYYDRDKNYLLELETFVQHYETRVY